MAAVTHVCIASKWLRHMGAWHMQLRDLEAYLTHINCLVRKEIKIFGYVMYKNYFWLLKKVIFYALELWQAPRDATSTHVRIVYGKHEN